MKEKENDTYSGWIVSNWYKVQEGNAFAKTALENANSRQFIRQHSLIVHGYTHNLSSAGKVMKRIEETINESLRK
jgi:hypothetical protein